MRTPTHPHSSIPGPRSPARSRRLRAIDVAPPAIVMMMAGCSAGVGGGGQTEFEPPRTITLSDIAVPYGFTIELVASGLECPTGVTFDDKGFPCIVESGYRGKAPPAAPRLLRIADDGSSTVLAVGSPESAPWNGVAHAEESFYVAAGGQERGSILRIDAAGKIETLVADLPSAGDHKTNGPVVGKDGSLYFGQGTATNAGVVGEDSEAFGWLMQHPDTCDIPAKDIVLSGVNFQCDDVLLRKGTAITGAFLPFGTPSHEGQIIHGQLPCNGAIFRLPNVAARTANSDAEKPVALELVAWGFRNPYALCIAPDGALYAIDNGYDMRGSRRVFGSGEAVYHVEADRWYGWPDFDCGMPLTDDRYGESEAEKPLAFLLKDHPENPPGPLAVLPVHSSADGIDISRSETFGFAGQAFIAEFGDQAPAIGTVAAPVGFRVVRVDLATGSATDFAVNHGAIGGPASKFSNHGLERPIALRFDPIGTSLYVVDFGVVLETQGGTKPIVGTGALFRIRRTSTPR